MKLVDIEKLEYEPFLMEETGETVDYVSAESLWKAPKVDPVNHAEWVREIHTYRSGDTHVVHNCSNCGIIGCITCFKTEDWENYHKDHYIPKLSNFCPDCGYKMDLRDLYEKYKREWCETRGYILEDVDERFGINGECYACFTEWYNNEYSESRGECIVVPHADIYF